MATPTIVVFGATSQLGSYVAKALVASYEVRGVTDELDHDIQIKELEDAGVQVQRVSFRSVAPSNVLVGVSDWCLRSVSPVIDV